MKRVIRNAIKFVAVPAALILTLQNTMAAEAYIISPIDGAVVSNPVTLVFGLRGFGIAPAGIEKEGTGHHHLLIDSELPESGTPIVTDKNHIHFGGGQTEAVIELEPGEHKLQLLLGDFAHRPHNPPIVSEPITIKVLP